MGQPGKQLRRRDGARLVPIVWAIGGTLALALAFAAAVAIIGLHTLHFHRLRPEPELSAGDLYNLLKVAFAFAAGVGGVFALVTAYRRQRVAEFAEQREAARLFNERFGDAAGQLGHESPAVRLAGVYAMARLADDWPQQRQTCVDVLCAYLRMPYQPDPGPDAPAHEQQAFRSLREVRHTVIRVITSHLLADERQAPTAADWRGLDFDFTGTVFDGGNFYTAQFTGGTVSFEGAHFTGAIVSFSRAQFTDGMVSFYGAQFTGATASFYNAQFTGAIVSFNSAQFTGGTVSFDDAQFTGAEVSFDDAQFTGGTVSFDDAQFTGGEVSFDGAGFTRGTVSFEGAQFTGGEVSFEAVSRWHVPPQGIDWANPQPGVKPPEVQPPETAA